MFQDDKYQKIHKNLKDLRKVDMGLMEALKIARAHNPDAGNALARHIFLDTLVPRVGNSFAYKDFLSRHNNSGVHLSLDANSFGAINKEHGFEAGNEAIKQLFNTVSDVSRKYGLKAFRVGGDEGRLHASTPERAHGFINELKERLDSAPHLDGTDHRLSVSVGLGYTPEHAEQALMRAKDQLGPLELGKRKKMWAPGKEPTVAHSLLHESPPPHWRPSTASVPAAAQEPISALKISNPLKEKP